MRKLQDSTLVEAQPCYSDACEDQAGRLEEKDLQMIALLVASGISLDVVSSRINLDEDSISRIVNSSRFEETLQELQRTLKIDASLGLLQAQKLASVRMLSQVRDDPGTQAKDRLAAAKAILQMSFESKAVPAFDELTLDSIEAEQREIKRLLDDPSLKHLLLS
jgi:hypothetical protein